jgi:translation initiation factor IF-1
MIVGHAVRGGALIACDGTVAAALAASFFRVLLDSGREVVCRPCGKMQLHKIAIVCGDRVVVELSAGGLSEGAQGRIAFRYTGDVPVSKPRHRRVRREGKARKEVGVLLA